MSFMDYIKAREFEDARLGLTQALLDEETPEQMAKRTQQARQFNLPVEFVDGVSPEEVAKQNASLVDWAAMQAQAPTLMRKLSDTNFAKLVKDDVTNVGALETAVWKLAPGGGGRKPNGLWQTARNSGARGAYSIASDLPVFGSVHKLRGYHNELDTINETEKALAEGKSAVELFGSETDPTGEVGLRLFNARKEKDKALLTQLIAKEAETTAWANGMMAYFPQSDVMQKLNDAKTLGEAVGAFLESPLEVLANVTFESLTQQLPAIPLQATFGASPLGILSTYATSAGFDQAASIREALGEMGIDPQNPEQIAQVFTDPTKREAVAKMFREADAHSVATGAFDALSFGIAGKTGLTPKVVSSKLSPRANDVMDTVIQLPVQGALGSAGEATGQLLAKGEIESWGSVVAEFAGEFATGPVDVFLASAKATETKTEALAQAQERAQVLTEIGQQVADTKLAQRDPESVKDFVAEVSEGANAKTIYLDPAALQDAGLVDTLRAVSPSFNAAFDRAIQAGEDIAIPTGEYVATIAPLDQDGRIAATVRFDDSASVEEATADLQAVEQETQKAVEQTNREYSNDFRSGLRVVGEAIDADLRAMTDVSNTERHAVRAVVQQAVGALAQDMGVAPQVVWERYGARMLDYNKAKVKKDGSVEVTDTRTVGDVLDEAQKRIDSGEKPPARNIPKGHKNAEPEKGQTAFGSFFPLAKLIARWRGAKPRTLIHEAGHMFLEMRLNAMNDLMTLVTGPLTTEQRRVVQIGQDILAWAGLKSFDEWQSLSHEQRKEIHEKWARSYEAYMMEGKAPVSRLEGAFRAFTKMLHKIYMAIASIPGQALDDDLRTLFNNIHMSQAQARRSALENQAMPLIPVEMLNLSPEARIEYDRAMDEMFAKAEAEHGARAVRLGQSMRAMLRRARLAAKKEHSAIRKAVMEELKQTRGYKAREVLRNGKTSDGVTVKPKIFWGDMQKLGYKDADYAKLIKAHVSTKRSSNRKVPLEELAKQLGYANGKELIDEMLTYADMDKLIADKAQERMVQEHPEWAGENMLERSAMGMWYNEARNKILEIEYNALQRLVRGLKRTEAPRFERIAAAVVAGQKLEELRPHVHANLAKRAARKAEAAYRQGDIAGALRYKQQEMYQTALVIESKKQIKNITQFREFIKKRYLKKKFPDRVQPEHAELIQRILVAVGFSDLKRLGLNPTDKSLFNLYAELINAFPTMETEINDAFIAELDRAPMSAISTVRGMAELMRLVAGLHHEGRMARTVVIEGKKEDLAAVTEVLVESIENNATLRGRSVKVNREQTGGWVKIADTLKKYGFSHMRIPSLLAAIEGKRFGYMFRAIIAPMDKCGSNHEQMKTELTRKLDALFRPIMKQVNSPAKTMYKSVGMALTKMQVLAIALNTGNEGNLNRLLSTEVYEGSGRLTKEQIAALITEALTAQELAIVQSVWDLFESIRPKTDSVCKSLTGRSPLWVEPTPYTIMSADGQTVEMRGGYYPITYDREASQQGAKINEITDADSMVGVNMSNKVLDGHTKDRQDNAPKDAHLSLTLRAVFEGLECQVHYIAWAEWVTNTDRLLRKIDPVIRKYWGAKCMEAIRGWLNDIRTGGRGKESFLDSMADMLRSNISLAGIGFNLVTAMVQPIGIIQSVPVVGGKWMIRGLSEFMANPFKAKDMAASLSPMMRNRMQTQFRELTEIQAQLNGTTSPLKEKFMRSAYIPIVAAQMVVDIPTWIGAYHKALSQGLPDDEAISVADRSVIDAQGSGRLQDLAGVERAGSVGKLFTVFYTFFNTALNVAVVSGHTKKGMERAVELLMVLVMQPVIESLFRASLEALKEGEADDDWWEDTLTGLPRDVAGFATGLFVGLREFQYLANEYKDYNGPGGFRKVTDIGRMLISWDKAWEDGEIDDATVKATVTGFGSVLGWPSVAINRVYTGGKALIEGDTHNPAAIVLGYSDK